MRCGSGLAYSDMHHSLPRTPNCCARLSVRQDIRLVGRTADFDGDQNWMVYDPVRHRFTVLDKKSYLMLQTWSSVAGEAELIEVVWRKEAEILTTADVQAFERFLSLSGLAISEQPGAWRRSVNDADYGWSAIPLKALHNYLFFRIPIVDPEKFLRRTLPAVRIFGTRRFGTLMIVTACSGLFLASREWEQFARSAAALLSMRGAMLLVIAIVLAKILHELSHAYVAINHNCRVPSLGIAFVLGTPMLYADVTDAWRLSSRHARLQVDAAGILSDLSIAAIATLAWIFLPLGIAKDIAFALATTGWVLSLMMNLNPFMKFDGYHLLADAVGAPNLYERASKLAQWRLRELLYALGAPPPEWRTARIRRRLVAFGVATWMYRVSMFTAIALAVYAYFFKLAGLILFAVEIGYFVVAPITYEISAWYKARSKIMSSSRYRVSLAVAVTLGVVAVVPWSSSVSVPAVLEHATLSRLHASLPAKVIAVGVKPGDPVQVGDLLFELWSPALHHEERILQLRLAVVDLRLSRMNSEASDRESAIVLEQERRALIQQLSGVRRQRAELRIVAPITGILTELAPYAKQGQWLAQKELLAVIYGQGQPAIRGLVDADNVARVGIGNSGRFVPDDLFSATKLVVVSGLSTANASSVSQPELASSYGGRIATNISERQQTTPVSTHYALRAELTEALAVTGVIKPEVGVLTVSGEPQSLVTRVWRRVLMVLVRESGF